MNKFGGVATDVKHVGMVRVEPVVWMELGDEAIDEGADVDGARVDGKGVLEDVGDVVWGLKGELEVGECKGVGESGGGGDGKNFDEFAVASKDGDGGGEVVVPTGSCAIGNPAEGE